MHRVPGLWQRERRHDTRPLQNVAATSCCYILRSGPGRSAPRMERKGLDSSHSASNPLHHRLNRSVMLNCLGQALDKALTRSKCLLSFEATGILPFNPKVILENPDFKKLNAHHTEGPSLFESLESFFDLPTEPMLTLDPESTCTQPREAWKEPLTGATMMARLDAKRKANEAKDEKNKKSKADRDARQDAKRDAALKLVAKLNEDTTIRISSLSSAEMSILLLYFREKDTNLLKHEKLTFLKDILRQKWANTDETPAILRRTQAISLRLNGVSDTVMMSTQDV
eukprot:m.68748 g.68748  ORF g.68748 m.68748 type:complete len:284 (+) comp14098_c0_seq65:963-1814(+)